MKLRTKKRRRPNRRPQLSVAQILEWADAFFECTGMWPQAKFGRIPGTLGETWFNVSQALRLGLRGLPGGSSLARLLHEHRDVRNRKDLPRLSSEQILDWADRHCERTGAWPCVLAGPVVDAPGETWLAIEGALRAGVRGLPGGSTLAQLLEEQRAVHNRARPPDLNLEQVLGWADRWHETTGRWPMVASGPIPQAPGETWAAVEQALRYGGRGLSGGTSLARALAEHRGVRFGHHRDPALTIDQILAWADAHHARTGRWPDQKSGRIPEDPKVTWRQVQRALWEGKRNLPGGTSLGRLWAEHRQVRNLYNLPPFTRAQILAWADAHKALSGAWPKVKSGPVPDAPGETWHAVDKALRVGGRGLAGGSSLARLLRAEHGLCKRTGRPELTEEQILRWADAHRARFGVWPTACSEAILDAPAEFWQRVDRALRKGKRGLPGGDSLHRLLRRCRGVTRRMILSPLSLDQVLGWADAFHTRTGRWPHANSGPVEEARDLTWWAVDADLRQGFRGLPGGSTLARLLQERRGVRHPSEPPRLTYDLILTWVDSFRRQWGKWPSCQDGPVPDAPDETWAGIDKALKGGSRGLPGGLSLSRLIKKHRPMVNRPGLPKGYDPYAPPDLRRQQRRKKSRRKGKRRRRGPEGE
jgi:hypothetical protein